MEKTDRLEQVFSNLDRWRHLPDYQLERRADVFFSIYLPELLGAFVGKPMLDIVIPKFPLKTGTNALSNKVDYVLFAQDRKTACFVELKTDAGSRRDEQDEYLKAAAKKGMEGVLADLKEICAKTRSYRKYYHLLYWLAKAEVVRLPENPATFLYPEVRPGLHACLAKMEVLAKNMRIEIVYIQPVKTPDCKCIDFDFIAQYLGRYDDDVSKMFARFLSRGGRSRPVSLCPMRAASEIRGAQVTSVSWRPGKEPGKCQFFQTF